MDFFKEAPPITLSKYDIEFFKTVTDRPRFYVAAHIHSAIEFLYFTKGNFTFNLAGINTKIHDGDLVMVPSNAVHSFFQDDDSTGEYYVLKLTSQYLFNIFKGVDSTDGLLAFFTGKNPGSTIFPCNSIPREIKSILENMMQEYTSNDNMMLSMEKAYSCIFVISVFRAYFAHLHTDEISTISRDIISLIHDSMEYINANYASDITAVECAKQINLSYSYYAKMFHTIVGKSFKEYLTAIRLAKAYSIIVSTDLPVTDVALSCGYNSHAYFTAEYKKYYGKTPSETRKSEIHGVSSD